MPRTSLICSALLINSISFAMTGSALAQDNPLAPGPAAPANPLDPANTVPGNAIEKVFAPDFIKSGARFIYQSGSSVQPDFNKPASAGVGPTRFDVVAVSDSKVYLRVATYLPARNGNGYTFASAQTLAIDAFTVKSGGAIWIDKNILAGYQTDQVTQVSDGAWKIDDRTYDSRSVTRVGNDTATRFVFDRGTGLLLANQICSGQQRPGMTDPFMRQNTSNLQFTAFRQIDLPWANAPTPAWARTVKRMNYRGQQIMQTPGVPPMSLPISSSVEFTERGDNWAVGAVTLQFSDQQPSKTPVAIGPSFVGGNWIDPATLNRLKPGVIDEDRTLGATLAFEFAQTPRGRLGVLTESNAARTYQLVWAYDLNDGAMVYASFEQAELNMKIELSLESRE